MKRRNVVSVVGATVAASLAGCLGSEPDSGNPDADEPDADELRGTTDEVETATGTAEDGQTGETVYGGKADDLSFEDSYFSPQQMVVTVHGIELTETLTYETSDGTEQSPDPGGGKQFALVQFETRNEGGSGSYLPPRATVTLRAGGKQYYPETQDDAQGQYTGGSVDYGVSHSGWIAYLIPTDLDDADLAVRYDLLGDDDWSATWQAE